MRLSRRAFPEIKLDSATSRALVLFQFGSLRETRSYAAAHAFEPSFRYVMWKPALNFITLHCTALAFQVAQACASLY